MAVRYTVKASIPAVLHRADGVQVRVTIPAGAVLCDSLQDARTPTGMIGVQWEERYYSVLRSDLVNRSERVFTA